MREACSSRRRWCSTSSPGERVIAIDLRPELKVGRQQAGVPKSRSMISETENPRPYDLGFYGGRYRD